MTRDSRGRSPDPKPIGQALEGFRTEVSPATPLARVQIIWDRVVGERIASVTDVIGEQEGVITVECSSAVWTQELELMAPRILARLNSELEDSGPEKLRFRTGG